MDRLYISDLDGTLLRNDGGISVFSRDTLNSMIADGLPFTVASARSVVSMKMILAGESLDKAVQLMHNLEKSPNFRDPQILAQQADRGAAGGGDNIDVQVSALYVPTVTRPEAEAANAVALRQKRGKR